MLMLGAQGAAPSKMHTSHGRNVFPDIACAWTSLSPQNIECVVESVRLSTRVCSSKQWHTGPAPGCPDCCDLAHAQIG